MPAAARRMAIAAKGQKGFTRGEDIQGSGFRVQGSGLRVQISNATPADGTSSRLMAKHLLMPRARQYSLPRRQRRGSGGIKRGEPPPQTPRGAAPNPLASPRVPRGGA